MAERSLERCGRKLKASGRRLCLKDCGPTGPGPCCVTRTSWAVPCDPQWCPGSIGTHCFDGCVPPGLLLNVGKKFNVNLQAQGATIKDIHLFGGSVDTRALQWQLGVQYEVEFKLDPLGVCQFFINGVQNDSVFASGSIGGSWSAGSGSTTLPPLNFNNLLFAPTGLPLLGGFQHAGMPPSALWKHIVSGTETPFGGGTGLMFQLWSQAVATWPSVPSSLPFSEWFIWSETVNPGVGALGYTTAGGFSTAGPDYLWCKCSGDKIGLNPFGSGGGYHRVQWANTQGANGASFNVTHSENFDNEPGFLPSSFQSDYAASVTIDVVEPCGVTGPAAPGGLGVPGPHFGGDPRVFGLTKEAHVCGGCGG